MDSPFEQFLQGKRYLDGVSSKTLVWYRYSYSAYRKVIDQLPNKVLQTFTDKHLEAIIEYKPQSWAEKRLHTLLLRD